MERIPNATVSSGYKPQSCDTNIDVDVLMFHLLRQLTPQQKIQRVSDFNKSLRRRCLDTIHSQYPNADPFQLAYEYIKRKLGDQWLWIVDNFPGVGEIVIADPIELAIKIANILEPLNIHYMIGGSVASSLFGENRFSEDLDLVIDIEARQIQQLIQALAGKFYISEVAVEEAFLSANPNKSFNIIELQTIEKVDIFIARSDPFSRSKMSRRQPYPLPEPLALPIYICSAEDIVLQKLAWRQINHNESQKQWRDILGVLKTQGERLDFDYLWQWAEFLNVLNDLDKAFTEAGLIAF